MEKTQKLAFLDVYNKQKWRCFVTWRYIPLDRVTAHCFPHILPKGMYPEYKFDTRNIVFVDCSNPMDVTLHKLVDKAVNGNKWLINRILESNWDCKNLLKELIDKIS